MKIQVDYMKCRVDHIKSQKSHRNTYGILTSLAPHNSAISYFKNIAEISYIMTNNQRTQGQNA